MRFKIQDTLDKVSFKESKIEKIDLQIEQKNITFVISGIIAKADLPLNEEFVDRYIDVANLRFQSIELIDFIKEGYKYYDANDVLISEKPSEKISIDLLKGYLARFQNQYIFDIIKNDDVYEVGIDCEDNDTYWLTFKAEKFDLEWEKFLNRVFH